MTCSILPRLIELSQALPESRVEYNSGKLPISQDPNSHTAQWACRSAIRSRGSKNAIRGWCSRTSNSISEYAELLDELPRRDSALFQIASRAE